MGGECITFFYVPKINKWEGNVGPSFMYLKSFNFIQRGFTGVSPPEAICLSLVASLLFNPAYAPARCPLLLPNVLFFRFGYPMTPASPFFKNAMINLLLNNAETFIPYFSKFVL